MRFIGFAIVLVLSWNAAAESPGQAYDWPTATPESQAMSTAALVAAGEGLAQHHTKSLLVLRNDKVVYEWYAEGQGADVPHYTASMAKAIVGGLSLGVALSDGRIGLDDKAAQYIPEWREDPRKAAITVRELGSHTSGVEDAEADGLAHTALTGWKGDFWKRLDPPRDPFTLSRDTAPVLFNPEERMSYSNPGIALLSYCITASLRGAAQEDLRSLLQERIMRPLGIPDKAWSVGYGATFRVNDLPLVAPWGGGNYTPHAAARVGQLMAHGGEWNGQQLLSRDAVQQISHDAGTPGNCGMGWWSNNEGVYDALPKDAFWGSGAGHQVLLVVPNLNLVAVRFGDTLEDTQNDPDAYHEPLRQWFFDPLMAAVTGKAAEKE